MTDSPQKSGLQKTLHRYVSIGRVWLIWEIYTPIFMRAFLFIGLFLIAAFTGLWERIGDPWRALVLVPTLVLFISSAYRAQKRRFPSLSDAKRRVEHDSDQEHRPLDVLEDSPAIGAESWQPHHERALRQSFLLKRPTLRPSLSPRDPYYLRYIMPLALIGALIYSSGMNMERLRSAVAPSWQYGINPDSVTFEAWIAPPDYTGRPPIYFKGQTTPTIPAGSEFVARLEGAKTVTRPKFVTEGRDKYLRLTRLSDTRFEARIKVEKPGQAHWRIGSKRMMWDLNVVADTPPTLRIIETPEADKQDRLVVKYSFEDDYGVTALALEMAEIIDGVETPFAHSHLVNIPLSSGSMPKAENADARLDLTRHVLAGKKVIARLRATDGADQTSLSDPVWFSVPDKIFVEPLAKAIVEQRNLILSGLEEDYAPLTRGSYTPGMIYNTYEPEQRMDRAPAAIQQAALLMEAVTLEPDDYFKDPALYMGLRNARARLRLARDISVLTSLPNELWAMALRAEFGVLGSALEEMREAEEALREGMARRAVQREIDTLFERYNNAVDAYTEELRRQAMEEGNFADEQGGSGAAMQSVDQIQELLEAIEAANRAGDVDGARRALMQLAELLENMKVQLSRSTGQGDGEGMQGEMSEEMKEKLEELADLLGEQRELQDETEDAEREQSQANNNQNGEQESQSALTPGELAARQEALQELLSRLGESRAAQDGSAENESGQGNEASTDSESTTGENGLDSAEEQLGAAARAMAEAAQALSEGDLTGAGQSQSEAIQALREAGEALAQAALGEGSEGQSGNETDPLGRDNNGVDSDNAEADIDSQDRAKRSRELMEELRRRAAEQERAQEERDYLERLLKRF